MAREIEVGCFLSGHPHAMPVWDADPGNTWFVMPVAQATATERLDDLKDPAALRALVDCLCSVLSAAHHAHGQEASQGWVHRDIKPSNVLWLDGRWVLADWGIARRPAGRTTDPQRTRVGVSMGSEGFAAPELRDDAHSAGSPADVYSLGRLIGWALTGRNPLENIPLLPDSGPWRGVVREATRPDPARRPATVQAFLELVARETETPPVPPVVQGETLRDALDGGSPAVPEQLVALAAGHPDDAALYCDVLLGVSPEVLMPALMADPPRAVEVVRAMPELLGTHRPPERGEVDAVILWLFAVARHAAVAAELHLLEECCNGAFTWDALWDQWGPQDEITPWLSNLTGDAAASVAGALRDHPDCARHFASLAENVRVDHRIRAAVSGRATPRNAPPAAASPLAPAPGDGLRRAGSARPSALRQAASAVPEALSVSGPYAPDDERLVLLAATRLSDGDSRRIALGSLVREWPEHPDTRAALLRLAADADPEVRIGVVVGLAECWWDDSAAHGTLVSLAQDEDSYVRGAVVHSVVAVGWHDAEALDTLLRLACDQDLDVRARASDGLADQWPDAPATRDTLLRLLLDPDEDTGIRERAVENLLENWLDDLETRDGLLRLAERERNPGSAVAVAALASILAHRMHDPQARTAILGLDPREQSFHLVEREVVRRWGGHPTARSSVILMAETGDGAVRGALHAETAAQVVDTDLQQDVDERAARFRSGAVSMLHDGWAGDAMARDAVLRRAQDPNPHVRISVASALVFGWPDDDAARHTLDQLAQDHDESVQGIVKVELRWGAEDCRRSRKTDPVPLPEP